MDFIYGFLKGMALGAGAIAPGVSGGALAVIFGLYDKITNFIAHLNINFKRNLIFFIPIGIGAVVGVLAFSRIIEFLFANYEVEARYAFVGLMLGTFPIAVKEANKKGFKKTYMIPFIASFLLTIVLTYIGNNSVNAVMNAGNEPAHLILYGLIIGFGTIIPGVSASVILMYIGAYELVIGAISNFKIMFLFFLGIGFILSVLLFAKLISMLFAKMYGMMYYTILGLVLGSIISIFPGFEMTFFYIINIIILISCFVLSYSLGRYAGSR